MATDHGQLEGFGQGSSSTEQFAVGEHRFDGFQKFAAAGRGEAAQSGQVLGHPDDFAGVGRSGGVTLFAKFAAEFDG